MAAIPPKIKIDPKAAMQRHTAQAQAAAVDRFSLAKQVISAEPTGLSGKQTSAEAHAKGFSIDSCVPGAIVRVPLHLIDLNDLGPRQIYQTTEIDKIASTLATAQDDAAHGFVKDGRVKLIDGGTRYRSAKVTGVDHLDVKFEEPPESILDLYLKARRYNDQRSQPSAIDHAISLRKLLESGAVNTHRDIMSSIPDLSGRSMSEAQVSTYMRISKMPDRVLQRLSESPLTNGVSVAYAVSDIFESMKDADEAMDVAWGVIDDIRQKELTKSQVIALVRSKLEGIKTRERSNQQVLNLGGEYKGVIKVFEKRGQVDLSLKGLPQDQLPQLQKELIATIEAFVKRQETGTQEGSTGI